MASLLARIWWLASHAPSSMRDVISQVPALLLHQCVNLDTSSSIYHWHLNNAWFVISGVQNVLPPTFLCMVGKWLPVVPWRMRSSATYLSQRVLSQTQGSIARYPFYPCANLPVSASNRVVASAAGTCRDLKAPNVSCLPVRSYAHKCGRWRNHADATGCD
jgi:hypothetical protein